MNGTNSELSLAISREFSSSLIVNRNIRKGARILVVISGVLGVFGLMNIFKSNLDLGPNDCKPGSTRVFTQTATSSSLDFCFPGTEQRWHNEGKREQLKITMGPDGKPLITPE